MKRKPKSKRRSRERHLPGCGLGPHHSCVAHGGAHVDAKKAAHKMACRKPVKGDD